MRGICEEHGVLRCSACTEIERLQKELETTKKLLDEAVEFVKLFSSLFKEDLGLWAVGEGLCEEEESRAYPHIEKAKEFLVKLSKEG